MDDSVRDDIVALVPPLLQSIEALSFIARYLHPPDFGNVMEMAGTPDALLREALPRLNNWPEPLTGVATLLRASSDAVLAAFDGLRAAPEQENSLVAVFKALRYVSRAQEALYPLAAAMPAVSRFFIAPEMRDDAGLQERIAKAGKRDDTGIAHANNESGSRGGFSIYVPEYYTPDRAWPVVFALHGGSGNGRAFLWSWLRDARSHGAILVSPTAIGSTWALMGDDADSPNLARILDMVRGRWNADPDRLLLTGMSDGGTFSYVSGLEAASPFTHLGPVASSFHPLMAEMADKQRMQGLPIYLVHGQLDWMFHVDVARQANEALSLAGANVTYREIDDLSHTYPREINAGMLTWLNEAPAKHGA
ncbi:MAG: phospholipase [Pseudomonadota bacterium]